MKTFHRVTYGGADLPARARVREILVADGADVNRATRCSRSTDYQRAAHDTIEPPRIGTTATSLRLASRRPPVTTRTTA